MIFSCLKLSLLAKLRIFLNMDEYEEKIYLSLDQVHQGWQSEWNSWNTQSQVCKEEIIYANGPMNKAS